MKQELRTPTEKGPEYVKTRYVSILLSFAAVAAGVVLAVLSYLNFIPLGYKLGPFYLNHWAGWLSIGFITIYVPLFIILRKRYPKIYGKLIRVHEVGFIVAFMLVSLHIGWQIRRVFPPELGTGIAAYVCLFVLVVTGIMQKNQIFTKMMSKLRFVHLSMVVSLFLVIIFHIIRAFLL
jgi:hypothetical protein